MIENKINAIDGYELSILEFEISNSKGVFVVFHGMEEHKERYIPLAHFLNLHGYSVVLTDMRSHGKTASELGFFKHERGFSYLIEDEKNIIEYVKKKYEVSKVNVFAHSMGTIIFRNYLKRYSKDIDKVILSGFPNPNKIASVGKLLAGAICLVRGEKNKSKLLYNLSLGGFNKQIENPKTNLDWLSYNEKNIQEYLDDPLCGFGFTNRAYQDLFALVANLNVSNDYINQNKDIPFLLIYGEDDPCTGFSKGVNDSINKLKEAGYQNIEVKKYPKMRHEILNEENNEAIYEDISKFIG